MSLEENIKQWVCLDDQLKMVNEKSNPEFVSSILSIKSLLEN